jgi:hypothetical protein
MIETYVEPLYRCLLFEMDYAEKLRIEEEINKINQRLLEYERFNSTRGNTISDNETTEGNQ